MEDITQSPTQSNPSLDLSVDATSAQEEEDRSLLHGDPLGASQTNIKTDGLFPKIVQAVSNWRGGTGPSGKTIKVHLTENGPDFERLGRDLEREYPGIKTSGFQLRYLSHDGMPEDPFARGDTQDGSNDKSAVKEAVKNGAWTVWTVVRSAPFAKNRQAWVEAAQEHTDQACQTCCDGNPCVSCNTAICSSIFCTVLPAMTLCPCVPCPDCCGGQCQDAIQKTDKDMDRDSYEMDRR